MLSGTKIHRIYSGLAGLVSSIILSRKGLQLLVIEKTLKSGKYSLWTIPGEETWTIILNSEFGQWGVNSGGEANRDPARDVLKIDVHAVKQDRVFEQFTIAFEKVGGDAEMVLMWDKTLVAVPFSY